MKNVFLEIIKYVAYEKIHLAFRDKRKKVNDFLYQINITNEISF